MCALHLRDLACGRHLRDLGQYALHPAPWMPQCALLARDLFGASMQCSGCLSLPIGRDRLSSWPLRPCLMRDLLPGGRRRSMRLSTHDYSANSTYFLTLCTYRRSHLFGSIDYGVVKLSVAGRIVRDMWIQTDKMRGGVVLDAFAIMPDHMHAIIAMPAAEERESTGCLLRRAPESLGALIAGFKASCTSEARRLLQRPHLRLWQRNYYERVIRNARALANIRHYIAANPDRWHLSHGVSSWIHGKTGG